MSESAIDAAIARGQRVAAALERLRSTLEAAMREAVLIGGERGLRALVAGVEARVLTDFRARPGAPPASQETPR